MSENSISLEVRNGKGEPMTLEFDFADAAPFKLARMRVSMDLGGGGEAKKPVKPLKSIAAIRRYLDEQVAADKFSGAVLIAKDSTVLFERAYGYADKRFKTPNTLNTKFNLGSINKQFTKVAIGQLAESGKLSFDDPFVKYLPDYPNTVVAQKVTIRQLYSMTSGMGDIFGDKFDRTPKDRIRTAPNSNIPTPDTSSSDSSLKSSPAPIISPT
jgi:CubicO group peptidase (beta-lactamase class C family)